MRAGAVSAICSTADRCLSQAWARYFYETRLFQPCDGIRYHSAHNNEAAIALFERAKDGLTCMPAQVVPINHPLIRADLLSIALQHNMDLML